jgi:hypothetical protein
MARGMLVSERVAPLGEGPTAMNSLTILLLIAMFATLGVLVVGLAGFFRGGEFNRKYGNKLMQARVALQAVAVVLLLVILVTAG